MNPMIASAESMILEGHKASLARALESHKHEMILALEQQKQDHERFMAVWRAVFEYAQMAIRTVILANGAGVTATITALGILRNTLNAQASIQTAYAKTLGIAACLFALGVGCG